MAENFLAIHGEYPSTGSGQRFPGEMFRVLKEKEVKAFGDASQSDVQAGVGGMGRDVNRYGTDTRGVKND